jgi:molecular chaperone DnaK (HSP70)
MKIAIDFGTTNTVIARWDESQESAELLTIPHLSIPPETTRPPLIPSLLYIHEGRSPHLAVGQTVIDQNLLRRRDNRLFRNFKRGIVAAITAEPRQIDDTPWSDREAGRAFLRQLLQSLPADTNSIEQLVLTAPVASFESYLAWLNEAMDGLGADRVQIVDESTAAALGYAVTEPDAVVLVFDFGGGTLDLSLVQLPESREKTGGFLRRLLRSNSRQHTARVIAKAGQTIGGSDIDQWLLGWVLKQKGLDSAELGRDYSNLLAQCEQAKIALSTETTADITFPFGSQTYSQTVRQGDLEALLEENGFYTALRRVVDKVMQQARRRGIFKEDIHYVLMVGGTSLMPSVQRVLAHYFTDMAVRADKPFTAVAEGALQFAAGFGLDDFLLHSYGLRHLDPESGQQQYDEIIPAGSSYPSQKPIEVFLGAAHADQSLVEFVVGEISSDAVTLVEVEYENGQAVFVAKTGQNGLNIVPLNADGANEILAPLSPPGQPGPERLKALFEVDKERRLLVTVTDIEMKKILLEKALVTTLR